jgi:signal peptidase II
MKEPQPGSRRFAVWMSLAALVVIVDQYTKYLVIRAIEYGQPPIPFASSSVLALTHQRNFGAAWSLLADAGGWQRWFFVVLATAVSGVLAVWLWRIRRQRFVVLSAGLALVLGGAVGNLVDRLLLGYVTDFIQVRFAGVPFFDPFPSFNVADAAITVGAVLLIIDSFFFSGREAEGGAARKGGN